VPVPAARRRELVAVAQDLAVDRHHLPSTLDWMLRTTSSAIDSTTCRSLPTTAKPSWAPLPGVLPADLGDVQLEARLDPVRPACGPRRASP
jgi:hypothetical protein